MKPFSEPFSLYTNLVRGRGERSALIEYSITAACGLGSMLFGYDQGVMGGLLTGTPFERRFPSISGPNDSTLQGFTVAVYEIGCTIGALSVSVLGDRLGRRLTVMTGMVTLVIGAVLQFMSYSLAQLIVGRVVTGIGNGMAVAVLPTWNGECSREHNRGRAILWQLNINIFGIMIAYWIDYGLNQSSATINNEWSWRFPLALQVVWAGLTIALTMFLPESPRYLIRKGRFDDARNVVDMLSIVENPEARRIAVDEQTYLIKRALEEERESSVGWRDCLTQGRQRHFQRLVLGTMVLCMLQLSGINLITYYAPVLFQDSIGLTRKTSLLLSGFNGLAYWLCMFIPLPLIDRLGRRPLLIFAAAGQAITMAIIAAMIADPGSKTKGYVATVMLFVFNGFFAVGFAGIPWLMPVEINALQTRAKAVAFANTLFWLCNFFVVMISPVLISRIKYGTYILWTGTNLAFIPLIYFLLPETLNAALEDIDILFETSTGWLIGPSSRKRMAEIVANRKAQQQVDVVDGHTRVPTAKIPNTKGEIFHSDGSTQSTLVASKTNSGSRFKKA